VRCSSAATTRAQQHTLKRDVGDWDEAEQEALAAIERAEAIGGSARV
jgi:hypothetical protein